MFGIFILVFKCVFINETDDMDIKVERVAGSFRLLCAAIIVQLARIVV